MKNFYFHRFAASISLVPTVALALLCSTGVARAADYTTSNECSRIGDALPAATRTKGQTLYMALVISSCQTCTGKGQIFHYQYTDKSTDTGTCDTTRTGPASPASGPPVPPLNSALGSFQEQPSPPGKSLVLIASSTSSNLWAVDTDKNLWKWNGKGWDDKKLPGCGAIMVTPEGTLWCIKASNPATIYKLAVNGTALEKQVDLTPAQKQIAITNPTSIWALGTDNVMYKFDGKTWFKTPIGWGADQITSGATGTVWGMNHQNSYPNLGKWNGATWEQTKIPSPGGYVAVGSPTNIWSLDPASGKVAYWNGTLWQLVPGTLRYIDVGSDGVVWGVNAKGVAVKWVKK